MSQFNPKAIFQFASKSDVVKIIIAITLLYVLLHFIRISMLLSSNDDSFYYQYMWNKLCLPSSFAAWIRQPWSLLTWFFLDDSIMRIIGNMIWLWIFGTVIEDLKGSCRILPVFITGGVLGGLLMLLANALLPSIGKMNLVPYYTSSTASVLAVAFAALRFKPQYRFWWFLGVGIPIWVFVIIFVAFQLASIQLGNMAYLFLLGGGVISGLLYTNVLHAYYEWFTRILKRSDDLLDNRNFIKSKPASGSRVVPFQRINFTPTRIDQILDKIHEKGIDSLSAEEKRLLDEYSNPSK